MTEYRTTSVIVDVQHEDGWYVGTCPMFPGVISQGRTEAELMTNMREAIELWFETQNELAQEQARKQGHTP
ncbi:MAG TPA: type II toxin-antitoxin system HicB family antitoxin [Drouetiella sp.]